MKIIGYLKILRIPNLLMVVVTMYLMRWSVISPILGLYDIDLQVSELAFLCLVISTVFIAAAGYVINDYHDVRADRINQPGRVVIDDQVSRRMAMLMHVVLNTVGVILGIVFSLFYRVPWMMIIFIGSPILLWYYSISLKHKLLIGNLAISFLTGTVPLLVILFEYPLLARNYADYPAFSTQGIHALLIWILAFGFFAFMTNLIREIIKDAEDYAGDKESGSRTVPICWGFKATNYIIFGLSLLTLGFLTYFFLVHLTDKVSLAYFIILLAIPFLFLAVKTLFSRNSRDYHYLSQLTKIIMLLGILYAPVVHYIIRRIAES
jgi:4-hydroxybenzoate polyprenyltransferase